MNNLNAASIQCGDLVVRKSGGPVMLADGGALIGEHHSEVFCRWLEAGTVLLEAVPAEKLELAKEKPSPELLSYIIARTRRVLDRYTHVLLDGEPHPGYGRALKELAKWTALETAP